MSKTEKATREYLETLSKEQVINLCLQFMFDIEVTEQQLAEKDKEIESLKKADNIWLDSYQNELDTLRQNQTQLAIQELEKVKEDCFNQKELVDFGNVACFMVDIADVLEIINNQIKELKGEKDVED